jgi:dTDP-4-dehydrorhamnose 3,5-epimerase-like enzyme
MEIAGNAFSISEQEESHLMAVSYERVRVVSDQRGLVLELLDAENFAFQRNAHVAVSFPGVVRGNHYHVKGQETITILGPALVRFRDNDRIAESVIPDNEAWRFVFPAGVAHAIKNLGREPNIVVAFNTVEHDPANPDTHADLLIALP